MPSGNLNSLICIPDYDEATNFSTYLIGHGWNADHAYSPEQLLMGLDEDNYHLVVVDLEMLADSEWSLEEYLEEIGPDLPVVVLTQPGGQSNMELIQLEGLVVIQHPYSAWDLKSAIAKVTRALPDIEEGEEEFTTNFQEEDEYFHCDDIPVSAY